MTTTAHAAAAADLRCDNSVREVLPDFNLKLIFSCFSAGCCGRGWVEGRWQKRITRISGGEIKFAVRCLRRREAAVPGFDEM